MKLHHGLWALLAMALPAPCATLAVGPGQAYAQPCAAIAAASAGDTIEIDAAGVYPGDVCGWRTDGLTLRGVGGRAKIDAAGRNAQGKAIWVITGNDTVVENIEFTGAAVPDKNGAGIRQEGRNLTVRNCYFHHNEDGILSGESPDSQIVVEYTEFAYNGAGDGYSHNFYMGHVGRFILRYCYSHHSQVGHLVKTRATENYILYNRLSDEADGTGSYEIDVPNGGKTFIVGNLIEQGPMTGNSTILSYREEGPYALNPDTSLYVVNNTFVNDRPQGGTFIYVAPAVATPAIIRNNIFYGRGTLVNQASAVMEGNLSGQDPRFAGAGAYDYHLLPGSPAIDAGTDPGDANGDPLAPAFQYVHPACGEARLSQGTIDAGAYERGGAGFDPNAPARCRLVYPGGVVNGLNFLPGPVAPGSIVTLFGANLAREPAAASGTALPATLGVTSVMVNDTPAPLFAVAPDQVSVELPFEIASGPATAVVTVDGIAAAAAAFDVAAVAPAVFTGDGLRAVAGTALPLYFTGQGATDPPVPTGQAAVDAVPVAAVRVSIGGQDAEVVSATLAPGFVGLAIATINIPALAPGDYPLTLSIGDAASSPVTLTVTAP